MRQSLKIAFEPFILYEGHSNHPLRMKNLFEQIVFV